MYPTYEWKIVADPKLPTADYVDACFTTAFHPAGHVCAVATQAGTIVVFDTSLAATENGDGVIAILKSTRQDYEDMRGAVRSMAFSPAPWDLFAWAEDQGRVVSSYFLLVIITHPMREADCLTAVAINS
jgi:hypothetical protein